MSTVGQMEVAPPPKVIVVNSTYTTQLILLELQGTRAEPAGVHSLGRADTSTRFPAGDLL
jgi:hypothetical protein